MNRRFAALLAALMLAGIVLSNRPTEPAPVAVSSAPPIPPVRPSATAPARPRPSCVASPSTTSHSHLDARASFRAIAGQIRGRQELDGADLAALRDLAISDPASFLEVARHPDNEDILVEFLTLLLIPPDDDGSVGMVSCAGWPADLVDGLAGILDIGTPAQKRGILDFSMLLSDLSESFRDGCVGLLQDSDQATRTLAINALAQSGLCLPGDRFETLKDLAETGGYNPFLYYRAIALVDSEDARSYLIGRFETTTEPGTISDLFEGMIELAGRIAPADMDRFSHAMIRGLGRERSESAFEDLVRTTFMLPPDRCLMILRAALASAPGPRVAQNLRSVIAALQGGESRIPELTRLLLAP